MSGKAIRERADPERLARVFREFRVAVCADAMERWTGGDRVKAVELAEAMVPPLPTPPPTAQEGREGL